LKCASGASKLVSYQFYTKVENSKVRQRRNQIKIIRKRDISLIKEIYLSEKEISLETKVIFQFREIVL
jgi:hypothetical protein